MNRLNRTRNGNIASKSTNLKIIHWNGGGRKWENKLLEIECIIEEYRPDICFISESNLWMNLDAVDMNIHGYTLHLPNTMNSLGHARLVMLARDNLNVQIVADKNEVEAAMLWVKVGGGRKNTILVGGIYRQHQLLGMSQDNLTSAQLLLEQELRWSRIVKKWRNLSSNTRCVVVGDMNLDHLKWASPDLKHDKMVDEVKNWIETCGFVQLVVGHTRSMRHQVDSLIDHVWSNCSERITKVYNDNRGASDHNVVGVIVSLKDIKTGGQNVVKRLWKDFDEKECIKMFKSMNWMDIMNETNVCVANSMMDEKINYILDIFATFKVVQVRTTYHNWITNTTKVEMALRDAARIQARVTDSEENWQEYRIRRNNCTKLQRADKQKYLNEVYEGIEREDDSAKLFSTTKKLLGWNQPGGPTCLKVNGNTLRRQKDIADCQMNYYVGKIEKIRLSLPQVNIDPLYLLKRMFRNWIPAGGMPQFRLQSVTEN